MKKILLTCALMSSLTFAEDRFFVGAFGGEQKTVIKANNSLKNVDKTSKKAGYGIKVGVDKEILRASLKFMDQDDEKGYNTYALTLNTDFIARKLVDELSLFAGLHMGYLHNKKGSEDLSGALYGLNAGLLYELHKNVELELGYRYSWSDSEKKIGNAKLEYDHVEYSYVGVNVLF